MVKYLGRRVAALLRSEIFIQSTIPKNLGNLAYKVWKPYLIRDCIGESVHIIQGPLAMSSKTFIF